MTTTRRPSARKIAEQRADSMEHTAREIASQAFEVGTSGQTIRIAALDPLTAALTGIRCYVARLASDEPHTALSFAENLKRQQLPPHDPSIADAAADLLRRLGNMTTEQFSRGGEREEREALRVLLVAAGYTDLAL